MDLPDPKDAPFETGSRCSPRRSATPDLKPSLEAAGPGEYPRPRPHPRLAGHAEPQPDPRLAQRGCSPPSWAALWVEKKLGPRYSSAHARSRTAPPWPWPSRRAQAKAQASRCPRRFRPSTTAPKPPTSSGCCATRLAMKRSQPLCVVTTRQPQTPVPSLL